MAFGFEVDFQHLDPVLVKNGIDLVYGGIFMVLIGLFMRVSSGRTPVWYPYLEKLMGVGFVAASVSLIFILPLNWTAVKIYATYYLFEAALFIILPATSYEGLPVPEQGGKTRKYKCNGLLAFFVTVSLFVYGGTYGKWWSLSLIYDNFPALLNTINLWSLILSVILYVKGHIMPTVKMEPESNVAYDLWFGVELNPEFFGFDIKFWSESRPGLIGWALIDISIAAAQYQLYDYVSLPLALVCIFQVIYVIDYFIHEPYIVSTWDITNEKFGFMLAWGDYVWVPFFYSFQMWLLVNPAGTEISTAYAVLCVAVFVLGYTIFRGSNRQKHLFKTWIKHGQKAGMQMGGGYFFNENPRVYTCKTRKGQLLVSGWWGAARHMNYTGDILIALAFTMPCALHFGLPPYSHLLFMIGLLLHRFARDDEACATKYGTDWDEYCRLVPHKLIPYIF